MSPPQVPVPVHTATSPGQCPDCLLFRFLYILPHLLASALTVSSPGPCEYCHIYWYQRCVVSKVQISCYFFEPSSGDPGCYRPINILNPSIHVCFIYNGLH
ncbi:hypothetical protein EMCRGX_G005400 [Ephydatia muelleri]